MEPNYYPSVPMGLLMSAILVVGIVSVIYLLNRLIRRNFKKTRDDKRVEDRIDAGHTLHAGGIIGRDHPEEGGLPLEQEKENPPKPPFHPL